MRLFRACVVMLVAASGGLVAAQTVYRCGNSYSESPCPQGTAVDVSDPRSAAQKRDSDTAAQRNARAADAMERARLKEEARVDALRLKQAKLANDTQRIADAKARYDAETKRKQQIQNTRSKVVTPDYVIKAKPEKKKKTDSAP